MIANDISVCNPFQKIFTIPSVKDIPASPEFITDKSLPLTPPHNNENGDQGSILSTAVHVLSVEAISLSQLSRLYATDPVARIGFTRAVNTIKNSLDENGKIVVCGVGKSGKVGQKLVATFNSLGLLSIFLHPTEAVHGDMGIIRPVSSALFKYLSFVLISCRRIHYFYLHTQGKHPNF